MNNFNKIDDNQFYWHCLRWYYFWLLEYLVLKRPNPEGYDAGSDEKSKPSICIGDAFFLAIWLATRNHGDDQVFFMKQTANYDSADVDENDN